MKKLIILMAPPGAGKSEIAEYLRKQHDNSIIINKNNFTKGEIVDSEDIYYQTINRLLKEQECVILDSQNVLYQDRFKLFQNLELENVLVIGVWIEVSRREADNRNNTKPLEERPKTEEVDLLFKYKVSPTPEEPFDDIFYIMRDADIGMSKSHPYMNSVFTTLDRIANEN